MSRRVLLALVTAVVAVSFSSIFIRFSHAPAVALSFYRLALSVPLTAAAGLAGERWLARRDGRAAARDAGVTAEARAPARARAGDTLLVVASGFFLALHFATWIASLRYTTVASSVVLVSSHPLVVGALAAILGDEPLPAGAYLAGAVALAGTVIVGWGDYTLAGTALHGDVLAFLGAVFLCGYMLIGRRLRARMDNVRYTIRVYAAAAAVLAVVAWLGRVPLWPYPPAEWLIFLALAVVPTLFGHTLFNWALAHIPATAVSISNLGEPVGSAVLAWLILGELPTAAEAAGGAVILAGLVWFARAMRAQAKVAVEG